MPQRDYMARSKKKKGGMNKSTLFSLIIVLLLAAGLGLWLLKENAPAPVIPNNVQVQAPTQKSSNLPSRPEEVYSYIRDLESREVITDSSKKSQEKLAQLTKEQIQQFEEKRKQEEAARLNAEKTQQVETTATNTETQTAQSTANNTATAQPTTSATPAPSAEQIAAQKAQEQKAAEEKRKQAELKKQQELAKKAEQVKQAEAAKAAEQAKVETAKKAEAPKETTAKPEKPAATAGRFGLQCGAFKNKAQAENMQARLAMSGFNARIVSSGEWNRVFVGPVGDRAAAANAQSNARSVAECLIVTM
ncbi:cell division protein FtsN [Haemophilus sputorum]